MKFKFKRIQDPVYKATIVLSYGDKSEYLKFMRKTYGDKIGIEELDSIDGRTSTRRRIKDHWFEYVVWIRGKRSYPEMTHEITHLTAFIFKDRGIGLDPENDEPIAYFNEYMVREYLKL